MEGEKMKMPAMHLFNKDYTYGLAVLDVVLQAMGDKLQVGLVFKNAATAAIKYTMENYELKLSDCIRTVAEPDVFKGVIIARDCNNMYYSPMMTVVAATPKPKLTGNLKFVCAYGHPDVAPVRRLRMSFGITVLNVKPQLQIMPSVEVHEEEDIVTTLN